LIDVPWKWVIIAVGIICLGTITNYLMPEFLFNF